MSHATHNEIEADLASYETRTRDATAVGAQAFARLLTLAEDEDSGQIVRIARFIAGMYNGRSFPIDPYELRAVDVDISDDMLRSLDALRWGRAALHALIPNGDARVRAVIERPSTSEDDRQSPHTARRRPMR